MARQEWNVLVGALRPGDVTLGVEIRQVERLDTGWYRVHGVIVRGPGHGKKVRTWSYPPEHLFPTVQLADG